MNNHASRLNNLEAHLAPAQNLQVGFISRDLNGNCTRIELSGQRFERVGDESEAAMRARAVEATGPFDTLMWVSWGRPVPGASDDIPAEAASDAPRTI